MNLCHAGSIPVSHLLKGAMMIVPEYKLIDLKKTVRALRLSQLYGFVPTYQEESEAKDLEVFWNRKPEEVLDTLLHLIDNIA